MKIVDLQLVKLTGKRPFEVDSGAIASSLDAYSDQGDVSVKRANVSNAMFHSIYLEVKTDEDVSGRYGPLLPEQAATIALVHRELLIGHDPLRSAPLWDLMFRANRHSSCGLIMMALSAVDNALWDLKGKVYGEPVYRLLGGPTRDRVSAYASCNPGVNRQDTVRRARKLVSDGFEQLKWFVPSVRHGSLAGTRAVSEFAEVLRSTVGEEVKLMFDCRRAFDVISARLIADAVSGTKPAWIEEPIATANVDSYRRLREAISLPIAAGEHLYTRAQFQPYVRERLLDILQPDPDWTGGITETLRIVAVAEEAGAVVIPHGHSMAAALHVVASQSPAVCPILEYHVHHQPFHQYFLADPIIPSAGIIELPAKPGLGMDLDERKVTHMEIIEPWR